MKELKELKVTKDECAFTVEDGEQAITVPYTRRELRFLGFESPLLEFPNFIREIGLWDNFSVAAGMNTKAVTVKPRTNVLAATTALLALLEKDEELYLYNYEYKYPYTMGGNNHSDAHLVLPSEGFAILIANIPGQLFLKKQDGTLIDMRKSESIDIVACTDPYVIAEIKLYKRKNHTRWVAHLRKLASFLALSHSPTVSFRHH